MRRASILIVNPRPLHSALRRVDGAAGTADGGREPAGALARGATRLTLALMLVALGASTVGAGGCDPAGVDANAVAAARADVKVSCDCAGAARHGDYVRCAAGVLRARVAANVLRGVCKGVVQHCAVRSTCGRPGAVTCCLTRPDGETKCHVKRDAAHCAPMPGGAACVGNAASCCDACTASGCAPSPTPIPSPTPCGADCPATLQTVFMIVMENHDWADIKNNPSAPYINGTLLPMASAAEQYFNPPGIHPSEPNYLWLEAGTNFGILNDLPPLTNHKSTTNHLVTLLTAAGISWKSYQEDISGTVCPLSGQNLYTPRHNPMVFFDDVTNQNDPNAPVCLAHVRPYAELATDFQNGTVARYNFITPNLCNDMHNTCAPTNDSVAQGDAWLATEVPKILASTAYANNGVLLITWDEGEGDDGPIGMIVLSPHARGGGYTNTIHYTHSSTLRTVEEIFGVTPLLGDAANATDLSDLFTTFP